MSQSCTLQDVTPDIFIRIFRIFYISLIYLFDSDVKKLNLTGRGARRQSFSLYKITKNIMSGSLRNKLSNFLLREEIKFRFDFHRAFPLLFERLWGWRVQNANTAFFYELQKK